MLSCLLASVSVFALHKVAGRVKCMNALRKRNPLKHCSIHPPPALLLPHGRPWSWHEDHANMNNIGNI